MKLAPLVLTLLGLTAVANCTADAPRGGEPTGKAAEASTACPGASTVEGVDVSEWQGAFDFNAVKAQGAAFAIVRVSYGANYVDKTFDANYPAVKAAGLVRGVYQYFLPSEDPIAQADLLIAKIGGHLEPGDLPPMIDLEENGDTGAQVSAWADRVQSALGVKPMIYTGYYFWNDNMQNPQGFGDYPLVVANYNAGCPLVPDEWSTFRIWQYSDGGGKLDHDKFNGSLQDLLAFANGGADYAAKFVSQTYPYAAAGPVALTVGQTITGAIVMQNVGKQTWKAGVTKLAPIPRDQASPFAAASWESPTRVSALAADVPPGQNGTFEWDLTATAVGDFSPYFGFVEEGVTWFADAPAGGGPPDNDVQVHVVVSAAAAGTDGMAGAGGGMTGAGGGMTGAGGGMTGAGGGMTGAGGEMTGAGGTTAGGGSGADGDVSVGGDGTEGSPTGLSPVDGGGGTGNVVGDRPRSSQTIDDESGDSSSGACAVVPSRGRSRLAWPLALAPLALVARRRRAGRR